MVKFFKEGGRTVALNSLQEKLVSLGLPRTHARNSFLPNSSSVVFKNKDGAEGSLVIDGVSDLGWFSRTRNTPKTRLIGFVCLEQACNKVYSYNARVILYGHHIVKIGFNLYCSGCKNKRSVAPIYLNDIVELEYVFTA